MKSRRDRPSRPWLLYALGVVAIAVAVLAVTEIGPPTSSARTSKEVVTAEQGVIQSTVTGTGNIAAGTDVTVNFNTSGTLQDVYVKAGQQVKGGQLLADLDPTSADLQLSQAQEQLTSAEDQLTCLQDQTTANCGSGGSGASGAGVRVLGIRIVGVHQHDQLHAELERHGRVRLVHAGGGQEQEADERVRPDADERIRQDADQVGNQGHEDDPERDRDRGRAEHESVVVLGRRVGAEDQFDSDHHDDFDAVAEQPRLGSGLGVQRAGRRPQRRDRGQ